MVKPWNAKQYSNLYLHDEHVSFQNRHEVLAVCALGYSGAKLVTPQLFQLSVVLATFVWRFWSAVHFVSCQWFIGIVSWIWLLFSSEDLSLVALRSDVALCFQFRLSSVFSRLAEYLFCCDILLSPRYSICLFCQHNIYLLIYTHINMHIHICRWLLGCILCLSR